MGAALWAIDERKLTLRRDIYDGRSEVIPIKDNVDMLNFIAIDITDYAEIMNRFEEACRQ